MPPKRKPIPIYQAKLMQKTLRKQMLREKMNNARNIPVQCKVLSTPKPINSPIKLRTSTNSNQSPLNFKISFNTTANNESVREIKAFKLSRTGQYKKLNKSKKQWLKVVCNMDIIPLHSNDLIMDGATLSRSIDLTSPVTDAPKIPITPPVERKTPPSYTLNLSPTPTNNSCPSTPENHKITSPQVWAVPESITSANNASLTLLVPQKRRLHLSEQPPPMFKVPSIHKASYRLVPDLRNKIKGNVPPIEILKTFNDDSISICAPTEMGSISDDDILESCGENLPCSSPIISRAKKADIMNWFRHSSVSPKYNCGPEKSDLPEAVAFKSSLVSVDGILLSDQCIPSAINRDDIPPNVQNTPIKTALSVKSDSNSSSTGCVGNSVRKSDNSALSASNSIPIASEVLTDVLISSSQTEDRRSNHKKELDINDVESPIFQANKQLNANIERSFSSASDNMLRIKRSESSERSQDAFNTSRNDLNNSTNNRRLGGNPNKESRLLQNIHLRPIHSDDRSSQNTSLQMASNPEVIHRPNFQNSPHKTSTSLEFSKFSNESQQRQTSAIFSHTGMAQKQTDSRYIRPMRNEYIPNQNCPRFGQPNLRIPPPHYQPPARNGRSDGGVYIRMRPVNKPQPLPLMELNMVGFNPHKPPPALPNINEQVWSPMTEPCLDSQQQPDDVEQPQPIVPMQLNQMDRYLTQICNHHYRGAVCHFGKDCKKDHQCAQEFRLGVEAINVKDLNGIVKKVCAERKYKLISETLENLLKAYISHRDRLSILELVQPILQVDQFRYGKMQAVLHALCRLNMPYKDAVLKILYYVGSSNRKLVDILFSITTENFAPSESLSSWPAIEQLLESATIVDHGVFSELCTRCLDITDGAVLTTLAQMLLDDPCRVDVSRMERGLVGRLCDCMDQVAGMGALPGQVRRRWAAVLDFYGADRDARVGRNSMRLAMDDSQLPTISSTLPGSSNLNFNPAPGLLQNPSNFAIVPLHTTRNIEQRKNSCSPDSSSFAACNAQQRHPTARSTSSSSSATSLSHPLPITSPITHPSLSQSIRIQHETNTTLHQLSSSRSQSITPPLSNTATYSCDLMTSVGAHHSHSALCTAILKSQYNTVAVFIAKERDASVDVICRIMNGSLVPVRIAYAFFDVLWDHMAEHFIQCLELQDVVMYILFNIYEFLVQENCSSEAAYLLTSRFSGRHFKNAFLTYKTFLPSGQCSPTQKCHKVIKLLLKEKLLSPCFEWFIRDEYQTVTLSSDLSNEVFMNEKNNIVEDFLTLSYRDLNIALSLIFFCVDRQLGDFKKHYNSIIIQMIANTDFKEKVVDNKERFYNDQYVYLSTLTLRSYIVEFYCHLGIDELLHLYDIISRDDIYPKLTGHENHISMRDTLKESEITLILIVFLHQIVQHRIDVTWDVKIRFVTENQTYNNRTGGIQMYPRNLIMHGNVLDAVKRLVNVLKSCTLLKNGPIDEKWCAWQSSGCVTLYKDHIQDMVRNYRGVQTFT